MSTLITEPEIANMIASDFLAQSATETLGPLAEETISETVNNRVDEILNDILVRFRFVSTHRTHGHRVPDMSPELYAHIDSLVSWPPVEFKKWECPAFDDLYHYYTTLCDEYRNVIPFGTFFKESLTLNADGQVEVYSWDKDSFQGQGTMIVSHGEYVKQDVRMFVLGHLSHTGTAVLVDTEQNVWFYNAPDAVDEYICGNAGSAMMVMKGGEFMSKDTPIFFIENHQGVTVQFDKVESDDL